MEHEETQAAAPSPRTPQTDEMESERVRSIVAARLFGAENDALHFGRFEVIKKLGQGGMGVVYLARDHELDRRVAIKILRSAPGEGKERMRREAQALARLSHPNVVQVHEVGDIDGELYIVMEYVEGVPLTDWEPNASLDAYLDVYLQAGRGLAAAHAQRMVHRDFKPDNVLVGNDGRVRVLDFGLAREFEALPEPDTDIHSSNSLSERITRTGAMAGTPAYMAPEQFMNEQTDARTDVFAYCVALWERAFGKRPFEARNLRELVEKIEIGEPEIPPSAPRVSPQLRRLMRKGLSTKPEARFDSMDELLVLLERYRNRTRRRLIVAAVVATVGVSAVAALMLGRAVGGDAPGGGPEGGRCSQVGSELLGAWDDERSAAIEKAFAGSEVPHPDVTWAATRTHLDAYAREWTTLRVEACRASTSGNAEKSALAARQIACLAERRIWLARLTEQLSSAPTSRMVARAPSVAASLDPVSECSNPTRSSADLDPRRVTEVAGELATIHVQVQLGSYGKALELAEAARSNVDTLGDPVLEGRLEYLFGTIHAHLKHLDDAARHLDKAVSLAKEAGDRPTYARALMSHLTVAAKRGETEQSAAIAEEADAVIAELGDPPALRVELSNQLGNAAGTEKRWEESAKLYEAALTKGRAELPETHPAVGVTLNGLVNAYAHLGRLPEAEARAEEAVARLEAALGSTHPYVAVALSNQGAVFMDQGRHKPVEDGIASGARGEPLLQKSLELREARAGKDSASLRIVLHNLGEARLLQQKYAEAIEAYDRAIEIKKRHTPDNVESIAKSLMGRGQAQLGAGDEDAARTSFNEARALWGDDKGDPEERAELSFGLARVTADRQEARALAKQALLGFEAADPEWAWEAKQVQAWLDAHPE